VPPGFKREAEPEEGFERAWERDYDQMVVVD
jgi:hypothetical protein